jgi:pimeloyl-ACP methyl ester carboxylesterase
MTGLLGRHLAKLPPFQSMQVGAGRLAYIRSGQGPSIVLFNGAGVTHDGWAALYPRIERLGTVLGWNRFGLKGSDPPRQPQTGRAVVASLRELLALTGLRAPYVLVAHSLGGLHANLFARLHPRETAGVLFLEATHPDDRAVLQQHETQMVRAIGRMVSLPQRLLRPNVHSELDCIDATVADLAAAPPFPPVPLRVVTGGRAPPAWMMSPAAVGARRAHQQALARLSPLGEQVIAQESGHFPQLTQPDLVLEVLADLVRTAGVSATPG